MQILAPMKRLRLRHFMKSPLIQHCIFIQACISKKLLTAIHRRLLLQYLSKAVPLSYLYQFFIENCSIA